MVEGPQVGPSPGVQGELKELLRKLGRFSCYQGNLWKLLKCKQYLGPGLLSPSHYLGPGLIGPGLISPGPELLAHF